MAATKKSLVAACVLILLAGAFAYFLRYSRVMPESGPDFSQIPYQLGQWEGSERRFADVAYAELGADTTTLRIYHDPDGRQMYLFIAYFKSQRYGGQIHSPRHCLPGSGWTIEDHQDRVLAGPGGGPEIPVNLLTVTHDKYAEYMWYWFVTRGGVNPSEYGLKLDLVFNSLRLQPTDAVFIRFNTMTDEDPAETERIGREFAAELLKYLEIALPFGAAGEGRDG